MSSGLAKQDIKTIIQVLEKYSEVETAVLYGSRAMDTYQRGSDIDIALKGSKLTSSICSHIHFELEEETLLPYFFDITDYQSIKNEKLKEHIDRVGKVIYGIDNGKVKKNYFKLPHKEEADYARHRGSEYLHITLFWEAWQLWVCPRSDVHLKNRAVLRSGQNGPSVAL